MRNQLAGYYRSSQLLVSVSDIQIHMPIYYGDADNAEIGQVSLGCDGSGVTHPERW